MDKDENVVIYANKGGDAFSISGNKHGGDGYSGGGPRYGMNH